MPCALLKPPEIRVFDLLSVRPDTAEDCGINPALPDFQWSVINIGGAVELRVLAEDGWHDVAGSAGLVRKMRKTLIPHRGFVFPDFWDACSFFYFFGVMSGSIREILPGLQWSWVFPASRS